MRRRLPDWAAEKCRAVTPAPDSFGLKNGNAVSEDRIPSRRPDTMPVRARVAKKPGPAIAGPKPARSTGGDDKA